MFFFFLPFSNLTLEICYFKIMINDPHSNSKCVINESFFIVENFYYKTLYRKKIAAC
jgi:hypothetical protein